ncbi:IS1634 family transposase [Acidiferrobacter thiooxydans]|uniref:IS1634 family transposase n=1 Tax=Acidiferrobacter thiooxydans TaxID=163359 RepID=UPI000826DF74|nr:IS1634 family transposase [Acidiferrobacter thiooxydans]UEN99553.1 IS1634 family transposase [Acidiferrobacter thiooxydans]UEO00910.1 IS1634 family transposase [Acidiferrobacter thiooxydans]
MFIRRTATRSKLNGESYFTYRLVSSERHGKSVRQVTRLNLGRDFTVAPKHWPALCARIEQILSAQASLAAVPLSPRLERLAQRYAARLVGRAETPAAAGAAKAPPVFAEVAVDSLEQVRPRSVGVEYVALRAIAQLGLAAILTECGFNGKLKNAALASVIARLAHPGSELATWRWLTVTSGLGELMEVDFEAMSLMTLYRASDGLIAHRAVIETRLFENVRDLFGLDTTVTLYDLTNTYFEGTAAGNPQAARGRSKEKRSDCPLVTLGLVLDGSGFVRRSETFAGNAAEVKTLAAMLAGLDAPHGSLVVMDAGIASEANLAWLVSQGYRYLVVSRKRTRHFEAAHAITIETASQETVRIQKVLSDDGQEVQLHCYSTGRQAKEAAIARRLCARLETGLRKLALGLTTPRGEKRLAKLQERIGRLKERSRVGQHYTITLTADESGERALALTWEKQPIEGTLLTHPGVYCLRTNETQWDAERLWRTYILLTDLEAVFRSLKSELGLRPIYHHKEARTDGHLFISVLAYQLVQTLRRQLKEKGIHESWSGLRETLSVQRRVTARFQRRDGRTLHVRKSTVAEPELKAIYEALGLDPTPGETKTLIV